MSASLFLSAPLVLHRRGVERGKQAGAVSPHAAPATPSQVTR